MNYTKHGVSLRNIYINDTIKYCDNCGKQTNRSDFCSNKCRHDFFGTDFNPTVFREKVDRGRKVPRRNPN